MRASEADAFSVLFASILAPATSGTRRRSARVRPTPSNWSNTASPAWNAAPGES
ncbi:hypothetical protein PR003_g17895 [Phytophthora rubi]|uniref:Uncharacterized protein n=1 Tax=Phytophthora rubi TaxID=129364 RepID=A0A6A4EBN4_9STRA|nr:hypothetical protein PR002_g17630 [Phytophthora rubi]KAE9006925.1 hypothetical protein PR001_g17088 [Phytophthora rubi]KAE9319745.1 hypothetical protein PR003_g17895 [Phytophthora rubi]